MGLEYHLFVIIHELIALGKIINDQAKTERYYQIPWTFRRWKYTSILHKTADEILSRKQEGRTRDMTLRI